MQPPQPPPPSRSAPGYSYVMFGCRKNNAGSIIPSEGYILVPRHFLRLLQALAAKHSVGLLLAECYTQGLASRARDRPSACMRYLQNSDVSIILIMDYSRILLALAVMVSLGYAHINATQSSMISRYATKPFGGSDRRLPPGQPLHGCGFCTINVDAEVQV